MFKQIKPSDLALVRKFIIKKIMIRTQRERDCELRCEKNKYVIKDQVLAAWEANNWDYPSYPEGLMSKDHFLSNLKDKINVDDFGSYYWPGEYTHLIATDGDNVFGVSYVMENDSDNRVYHLNNGNMELLRAINVTEVRRLRILWLRHTVSFSTANNSFIQLDNSNVFRSIPNMKLNPDFFKKVITHKDFQDFVKRDRILRLVD